MRGISVAPALALAACLAAPPAAATRLDYLVTGLVLPRNNHAFVLGTRVYVGDAANGTVTVYDAADPANLGILGTLRGLARPGNFWVSGNRLYLNESGSSTLAIYDVADPASPVPEGRISTGGAPHTVIVAGSRAYLTASGSGTLEIYDVGVAGKIRARGTTGENLGNPRSLAVSGSYAYVTDADADTVASFDVGDPDRIRALGVTGANGLLSWPGHICVEGDRAYVSNNYNRNVVILDVSEPARMRYVTHIVLPKGGSCGASWVHGHTLYLYDSTGYVHAYDVSTPSSPVLVWTEPLDQPTFLHGNGGFLGVATREGLATYPLRAD